MQITRKRIPTGVPTGYDNTAILLQYQNDIAILQQKFNVKEAALIAIQNELKQLKQQSEIFKGKLEDNGISLDLEYSFDKCKQILIDNNIDAFDLDAWVNNTVNKNLDHHYKLEYCSNQYLPDLINEKDFNEIFNKLGLDIDDKVAIKNWIDDPVNASNFTPFSSKTLYFLILIRIN